jgi:hypothetical protein
MYIYKKIDKRGVIHIKGVYPLETSGLDPEITICKIVVLPVKLCPLIIFTFFFQCFFPIIEKLVVINILKIED